MTQLANGACAKVVHVLHVLLSIGQARPSPDNALLYHPVTADEAATLELADSIRGHGILEPIVVTADYYIVSGHRRHMAAQLAGLKEIPCRKLDLRRGDGEKGSPEFLRLLREHNRQRIKTRAELLLEAVASVDQQNAHRALIAYRSGKSKIKVTPIDIREVGRRKEISEAKRGFLDAVKSIIGALEEFWPLSLRQIHYQLLNAPPLIHSKKRDSRYRNNVASYKALSDLVTRARIEGSIDHEVIDDPTRPVSIWDVHKNVSSYYEQQMEDLLNGYSRDYMQSQAKHIEIVVEKNTLRNIVKPIAMKFCIPFTIGRGQCSTRPLYNIADRFRRSGRDKLVILAVSDLDPDGDQIAHSLGQRLRDDYGISAVSVIKTALTMEQVRKLKLPSKYELAKPGSPNYRRYVRTHRTESVWELEAVAPQELQRLITESIDGVIDKEAFNSEVDSEIVDAVHIAISRRVVVQALRERASESLYED
jgi:hypothetical protein